MYYTGSQQGKAFQTCYRDGDSTLFRNIPPGSDTPPAEMPRIESEEDYYNNYNGNDINKDLDAENDIHTIEDKLKTDIEDHIHEIDAKEGGGTSTSEGTSNDQPTEPPQTETKEEKEEEQSGSRGKDEIGAHSSTAPPPCSVLQISYTFMLNSSRQVARVYIPIPKCDKFNHVN